MNRNPYSPPASKLEGRTVEIPGLHVPATSDPLYTSRQIFVASFLGSPVAAAWIAAANLRALAQPQKARQVMYWGVAATAVALGIAFALPARTPGTFLPLAYSIAFRVFAGHQFGKDVRDHLNAGGAKGSWWRVIGIGLAMMLAVFACIFLVLVVRNAFQLAAKH
jgi:hypothetical protein